MISKAMSRALELHPHHSLPKQNAWENENDIIQATQILNRIRGSLLNDSWPHKVFAFHRLYRVPGGDGPIQHLDRFRSILRQRLLNEEVRETLEASEEHDLIGTVDGLLDTIYVAIGWLLELGLTPDDINRAMEEVHASNMTKVDDNGNPVYDDGGKVLKGANYIPCDLQLVLNYTPPTQEPSDGQ